MTSVSERDTLSHLVQGGQVLSPDDAGYGSARQIWNALVDRRPALIVHCASASEVPHVVRFARDRGLELASRGGG